MTDKNGTEIKTGMIVEITGAYFKNDNGLYFVAASPGDPNWCGSDHSLKKISKTGKISKAKDSICFWPICVFISNRAKRAEARRWNEANATIELKPLQNMAEVAAFFRAEAADMDASIRRAVWDFGEDADIVQRYKGIKAHYEAVAQAICGGEAVRA